MVSDQEMTEINKKLDRLKQLLENIDGVVIGSKPRMSDLDQRTTELAEYLNKLQVQMGIYDERISNVGDTLLEKFRKIEEEIEQLKTTPYTDAKRKKPWWRRVLGL